MTWSSLHKPVLTVLIVGDAPSIVALVRITVEDHRVRVVEATDGQMGLTQVRRDG